MAKRRSPEIERSRGFAAFGAMSYGFDAVWSPAMDVCMSGWSIGVGILGVAMMMVGCGGTSVTRTGAVQPERPAGCEFDMFTTVPAVYVEIATVDHTASTAFDVYRDLAAFKEAVRPKVCEAGGD